MRIVKWVAIAVTVSIISAHAPASGSVVKAGAKCTKVNQVVKSGNKEFFCSKKKLWVQRKVFTLPKTAATPNPTSTAKKQAVLSNPVIARINSMLLELPKPALSQAPDVNWIFPVTLNPTRVKILQTQHQRLSNQYPEFYRWSEVAIAVVDSNPTDIIKKLVSADCGAGYIQSVKRLEADSTLAGAGTSFCDGKLFAYFLDRNMSDQKWNFVMGSEYGGIIQMNIAKAHKFKNFPNSDWYSATPNWYAEGGQTLISVIAEAVETRKWSFDLKLEEGMQGDWCMSDTLEVNRCSGVIGIAAVELAIALYGFDAPLTLFKFLEPDINQALLFESGFPDTFTQFNKWSVAYLQYLRNGTELPAALINRLKPQLANVNFLRRHRKARRLEHSVPLWYHLSMAMNLRLSAEQTAGLRAAAEQDGVSMQEAALAAVDAYISRRPQRLADAIARVAKEDAELLQRLAQ